MKKKKIQHNIIANASYDTLATIVNAVKEYDPDIDFNDVYIEHEQEWKYGESYDYVRVYTSREETDEEFEDRKAEEAKWAKRCEAKEREQFELLKKKFGD